MTPPRLAALGLALLVALAIFFLRSSPAAHEAARSDSNTQRDGTEAESGSSWNSAPLGSSSPRAASSDDVARVLRMLETDPDGGEPVRTGIGIREVEMAGVSPDVAREALDTAQYQVLTAAMRACALSSGATSPVTITLGGSGEEIESMSSNGPPTFSDCANGIQRAYLPHDPARRVIVVTP